MPLSTSDQDYLKDLFIVAGKDAERRSAVTKLGKSLATVAEIQDRGRSMFRDLLYELDVASEAATASIAGLQSRPVFSANAKTKKLLKDITQMVSAT